MKAGQLPVCRKKEGDTCSRGEYECEEGIFNEYERKMVRMLERCKEKRLVLKFNPLQPYK